MILNTHDKIKNEILDKGYKLNLNGEHFENDLVAGQIIVSGDLSLIKHYEELSYIKLD